MKTVLKKAQKEINAISKLQMIEGKIYLTIEVTAKDSLEFVKNSNLIIDSLTAPVGFRKLENSIYKNELEIIISTTKLQKAMP